MYLRYKSLQQVLVETGDGTQYVVLIRHDIALVEVQEKHVGELLLKRCGCGSCGGNPGPCFRVATAAEIEAWKSNG